MQVQSTSITYQLDYMQKFSLIVTLILVFSANSCIIAQKLFISGSLGVRSDLRQKSTGFQNCIALGYDISRRWEIGLKVGHGYTESESQVLKLNSPKAYIRHLGQPIPEGVINGLWDKSAFPGIDLPDKGNRYNDQFISLQASYTVKQFSKSNIYVGCGIGINRRDHSEQINAIIPSEIYWIFGGFRTYDNVIPIYSYNTFIDFSILPSISYEYKLIRNLGITIETSAFIYPVSKTVSLSQSLGFNLGF
jgi:hypothetical protein